MKELSVEQKARAYDEAKLRISAAYNSNRCTIGFMNEIFPELRKSEDEKIRNEIIKFLELPHPQFVGKRHQEDWIAWLEKQGELSICNIPSREIILAIWDLGNEWKELTKGSISTEYGTQLGYIQKHWQESEYYLRAKQGEQKPYGQREECLDCQVNYAGECKGSCELKRNDQNPAWSEEDERIHQCLIQEQEKALDDVRNDKYGHSEIISDLKEMYRERIDWLKSIKERIGE